MSTRYRLQTAVLAGLLRPHTDAPLCSSPTLDESNDDSSQQEGGAEGSSGDGEGALGGGRCWRQYRLVGADLSQLPLAATRLTHAGLDPSRPTLFLSECVLTYVRPEDAAALLRWCAAEFRDSIFLNYEQIGASQRRVFCVDSTEELDPFIPDRTGFSSVLTVFVFVCPALLLIVFVRSLRCSQHLSPRVRAAQSRVMPSAA
eukprot:COSAG04_NODE_2054_length_4901_cov_1.544565_2_plen_202_part_00